MRKSYHSTAVPITLDHTIRCKLAVSSGATFRATSSATVIDLSRSTGILVLSVKPIGSPNLEKSTMFTDGNQRRETRQLPRGSAERLECLTFRLLFVEYQRSCSQYPRCCLKFPRISFLQGYT